MKTGRKIDAEDIRIIKDEVIKPMYENGKVPLEIADFVATIIEKQMVSKDLVQRNNFNCCPNCLNSVVVYDKKPKPLDMYCRFCGQLLK